MFSPLLGCLYWPITSSLSFSACRLEAELEKLQKGNGSGESALFSTPCWNLSSPWENNGTIPHALSLCFSLALLFYSLSVHKVSLFKDCKMYPLIKIFLNVPTEDWLRSKMWLHFDFVPRLCVHVCPCGMHLERPFHHYSFAVIITCLTPQVVSEQRVTAKHSMSE